MNNTRKITEGAMMAAIIGVFLFLNRESASLFDFILNWITPIPLAIYTIKYGLKNGLLPYVAIIVIAIITGMNTAIYYCVVGGFIGLMYGYLVSKRTPNHFLILLTCSISILSIFISLFVLSSIFGYNLVDMINEVTLAIDAVLVYVPSVHIDKSIIPMIFMMSQIFTGLLEGLLIHLLTQLILVRLKICTPKMKPLMELKLNKVMGYISGIAYGLSGIMITNSWFMYYQNAIYFINIVSMLILAANGYIALITILAYNKKRKYLGLVIICIFPPFTILLVIAGFLDAIKDLREELTIKKVR